MSEPLRIAMWSGPRNLSTALMRSFSSRPDTAVVDEPFYAAYLARSGVDHPMRAEVLKGESDPARVAEALLGPVPGAKPVFYQKHMLQHMVDGIDRDWFAHVRHVFLIRDPARVLASYAQKREEVTAADLGLAQSVEIFDAVRDPIVVEADDIRADPEAMLSRLCAALGLVFCREMLSWPKGPHPSDGIWGAHWYDRIWASTGFDGPDRRPRPEVDLPHVMAPAMEIYRRMRQVKLRVGAQDEEG